MSIVKSLLLGSAAGLVAVASAQAADLPAKAKAVEYVKVCDAYGAGFYYIPGTDTCLKVGGYVRADYYVNESPGVQVPLYGNSAIGAGGNVTFDRADDLSAFRSRAAVELDARARTEYGTLRSYGRFYVSYNSPVTGQYAGTYPNSNFAGQNPNTDRAFIQFAGFTFGYVQSFFDYAGYPLGTFTTANIGSNKLTNVFAYTASLGNGLSLTIAAEDATYRRTGIQSGAGTVSAVVPATVGLLSYADTAVEYQGGQALPDIVANIRVDQSWGSAQLSGAIHQLRAFDSAAVNPATGLALPVTADQNDTDYGYAIGAGITFNLDALAKGDQFIVQGSYASGVLEYTGVSAANQGSGRNALGLIRGTQGAVVDLADAYINPVDGSIEKVDAWTIRADFRHFWTPSLRSTVFGGYTAVDVPYINGITAGSPLALGAGNEDLQTVRDFNLWQVGFNTTWSPVRNLDIGVEVLYTKIDPRGFKNYNNASFGGVAGSGAFANAYVHDEDIFSGVLRVQRNF